jgi:hypothetical protein
MMSQHTRALTMYIGSKGPWINTMLEDLGFKFIYEQQESRFRNHNVCKVELQFLEQNCLMSGLDFYPSTTAYMFEWFHMIIRSRAKQVTKLERNNLIGNNPVISPFLCPAISICSYLYPRLSTNSYMQFCILSFC